MTDRSASLSLAPTSHTVAATGVLRRKCSCGSHAPGGGECEHCKQRLRRRGDGAASPAVAPGVVNHVLATSGQPLDGTTRGWMEHRFGHDFSGVRVHADGAAATSARAVGALAYTVGRHVVFDHHQYAPHTHHGRHLLAHELAHTIQDPGADGLHTALAVGDASDPSEVAADRAADAVMRGERASVAPMGGGVMRRQVNAACSASPGQSDDERKVSCPGDGDYRVKMTLQDKPARPETNVTVNPGWNKTAIWLDIAVCRGGTQVTITPSVDLPKALGAAVANLVAGSDLLKGVSITPGLKFVISQSSSYTLTVGPTVTVDQKGVSGVGGSVEVQTKDVDVKADATYDPRSKTGFINFTFSGGATQPTVDCHTKGKQYAVFTCERISHVADVPPVKEQTKTSKQTQYVFFEYAKDMFRHDLALPAAQVQQLIAQGYKVAAIRGFTSPEGPRGKEHMPRFEGNDRLAVERAEAARRWLQSAEVCKSCDLSGVPVEGQGELPPAQGTQQPEPKGRSMEKGAVDEFLGNAPGAKADPMAPSDPAEREKFQKLPFNEQRERTFKAMRRAAIDFEQTVVTQPAEPGKPAHDEYQATGCPDKVIEAAQASFGINVATGLPSVGKGGK